MALTYDTWATTSTTYDGLTGTYNAPNYPLAVTPGAVAVTGQSASLLLGKAITTTTGSFTLTGSSAATLRKAQLLTTPGAFALGGQSASLLNGYLIATTPGSTTATGVAASQLAARVDGITPGAVALAGSDASLNAARVLAPASGWIVVNGLPAELVYSGEVAQVIGMGFEMGGKTVREVSIKPLLDRILEARAERIKPVKKSARAKARVIEGIAAELAMNDGGEKQFRALMDEWLAQKPELPDQPGLDVEQLFMAQVAMRVQRIQAEAEARRLFEQDEEDALMALLA